MSSSLPSFDQLMSMAKTDPHMLEKVRQNAIDEIFTSAPDYMQQRLRGLQFQIDCKRKLHSNPMGSCVALSKMMHESLNKLNLSLRGDIEDLAIASTEKATVLSFPAVQAS